MCSNSLRISEKKEKVAKYRISTLFHMNKSKICIGLEYKKQIMSEIWHWGFFSDYVFTAKINISILNCLAQLTCRNYIEKDMGTWLILASLIPEILALQFCLLVFTLSSTVINITI